MTAEQQSALRALGRTFASTKSFWGRTEDEEPDGSLIDIRTTTAGASQVYVRDAVGVIRVGDLTLTVRPKIPLQHFIYLLQRGGIVPRVDATALGVAPDTSLWELVARWFLIATTQLLRSELLRDYRPERDNLAAVRGNIDRVGTTRNYYQGRPFITCNYEEFDLDHPLNRVIRAATRTVVGSPLLPPELRGDARRLSVRLDGIGDLKPGDLSVAVDRHTARYAPALELARLVLGNQGQALEAGHQSAWSFLIRSAAPIEAGIRVVIADALNPWTQVDKRGRGLMPLRWTLNPDLVFSGASAVGDVKYTLAESDWKRNHLYQAVTFATGFRASDACIIVFQTQPARGEASVHVADIRVSRFAWPADDDLSALDAAIIFTARCRRWWGKIDPSARPAAMQSASAAPPSGVGGVSLTRARSGSTTSWPAPSPAAYR